MKLKALIEKRNDNLKKMDTMLQTVETEQRAFTEAEQTEYDKLTAETRAMVNTIHANEQLEGMSRESQVRRLPVNEEARSLMSESEQAEVRCFVDFLRGTFNPGEERAAVNMTKGDNGSVVPATIANKIITQMKNICPIYAKATHYNVKGQLTIPYLDATGSDIVVAYAEEFKALASTSHKYGSVTLTGYLFGALTLISQSLMNNSDFDVGSLVVDHMAENFSIFIEGECLHGSTGKITGALAGCTQVVTAASATAVTADELIDLQESVHDVYQVGSIWIMNQKTRAAIRKLKDGEGRYLLNPDATAPWGYMLLGKPVFTSDNMEAMAAGKDAILYGDMSGLAVKETETVQVQVLREKYADMHAIGVVGWCEMDAKVENAQKLAKLAMKAGT